MDLGEGDEYIDYKNSTTSEESSLVLFTVSDLIIRMTAGYDHKI